MFQDNEIGAITTGGPFGHPPPSKYDKLISLAKEVPSATTIVVHPCDETSLRGAVEAAELGIIVPILVGPAARISAVAKQHGIDIARYELVDAPHSEAAAAKAVALIHESKGELLRPALCSARGCRSFLLRARTPCARAWRPVPSLCSRPMLDARLRHSRRLERRWRGLCQAPLAWLQIHTRWGAMPPCVKHR